MTGRRTAGGNAPGPAEPRNSQRDGRTWMAVVCACFAVLLYVNTLHHAFALDDYPTIYGNQLTMSGVKGIPTLLHTGYWYGFDGMNDWLYRPLSMVMFAAEWQLAPNSPALGHWINVVLYALTAVVLFRFLSRLFDDVNVIVPFAIALLWIGHPVHTEVVANIKSRDELLAFLLSIVTMGRCLSYVKSPRTVHLLLAGFSFFLALMAKESPITLLVIVPMTLFAFTRSDAKTIARAMIPVAVAAGVYLAIRSSVLTSQTGDNAISLIDNSLVAAPDLLHRYATAMRIGGSYLRLLVFPHPMSSDYSYRQIPVVGFDDPYAVGSLIVYVALAAFAAVRLIKRDPIGYGILFYLISIGLVANVLFLTRSTMADRFLFTPSLGFCVVLGCLLARLCRVDLRARPDAGSMLTLLTSNRTFSAFVAVLLVASTALTVKRNPDWKDDATLFSADTKHSPNSARLHFLNGNHRLQELERGSSTPAQEQEQYAIVLAEFHRAIALYPLYPEPHMGIGEAYTYRKDFVAAAKWYQDIVARNPRYAPAYAALGYSYLSAGDPARAIPSFVKALAMNPYDAATNNALAAAYRTQGDSVNAQAYQSKAFALDHRFRER